MRFLNQTALNWGNSPPAAAPERSAIHRLCVLADCAHFYFLQLLICCAGSFGLEALPGRHQARGGVHHPGPVTSSSQDHIEREATIPTHRHSARVSSMTWFWTVWGKRRNLEGTYAGTARTSNLHTEDSRVLRWISTPGPLCEATKLPTAPPTDRHQSWQWEDMCTDLGFFGSELKSPTHLSPWVKQFKWMCWFFHFLLVIFRRNHIGRNRKMHDLNEAILQYVAVQPKQIIHESLCTGLLHLMFTNCFTSCCESVLIMTLGLSCGNIQKGSLLEGYKEQE